MDKENLPIHVICATRLSADEFLHKSPTGVSLNAFIRTSEVKLTLFTHNSIGLPDLYNRAIENSAGKPAILVFMHDDVFIPDFFWTERVREGLKLFDIVGIAGNKRRLPRQPGWIVTNLQGRLDDFSNLSGAIGQGSRCPPEKLDVFGPPGAECKLLDGVFLASSSMTLNASNLRFDPKFSFHFYDLDFCRSAEIRKLRMGTIPMSAIHASYGEMGERWLNSYHDYLLKWKD